MKGLRITISVTAVVLIIVHLVAPALKIDAVTLALLVVAALPWLAPLVRSVELPGGLKVELQDVKAATDKVTKTPEGDSRWGLGHEDIGPTGPYDRRSMVERLASVAASDGNLALVGAGIEIEKRLRDLAEGAGLDASSRSATYLLAELVRADAIPPAVASGLRDLIALRNKAAHGVPVTEGAARWALDELPIILRTLDAAKSRRSEGES